MADTSLSDGVLSETAVLQKNRNETGKIDACPAFDVRLGASAKYLRDADPEGERLLRNLRKYALAPRLAEYPIAGFTPDELGQAEAAARYLTGFIKWCPETGWLVYDQESGIFRTDYTALAVQEVLTDLAKERADLRGIPQQDITSAFRFAKSARTRRGIADTADLFSKKLPIYCHAKEFDRDPFLLNCMGEVFDLKTGARYPASAHHLFTKTANYRPVRRDAPLFRRFLGEITCGDSQLARWLLRWMGYCLTGDVKTAYFANFYGVGGNGKGVLLRLLLNIMGSYGVSLSSKAVVLQGRETEGRFEYGALPGARLAVVDDVPAGRLAEGFIKTLTGEGSMRIEQKYRDSFEFKPVAKLILASNHQLNIRDTGNSMRRRLRTIPFNYIPGKDKADPELEAKLLEEAPAILALLIEQALEYYRRPGPLGFPECFVIEQASREYLDSQDTARLFLDERTEPGNGIAARDLYAAYKVWCEANGHKAVNVTLFGYKLKQNGIPKERRTAGYRYESIALKD